MANRIRVYKTEEGRFGWQLIKHYYPHKPIAQSSREYSSRWAAERNAREVWKVFTSADYTEHTEKIGRQHWLLTWLGRGELRA